MDLATTNDVSSGSTRVFVYGTLKKKHGNHHLLAASKCIGRSVLTINGKFVDLGCFPGLVPVIDGEPTDVYGEIYEVDAETLRALDFLEGNTRFYTRRKVKTVEDIRVWVYCLPREYLDHDEVVGGCWRPTEQESSDWGVFDDQEAEASG